MAADTLYFLRNTRPLMPGASVTSNPWSRNHARASSYDRAAIVLAISLYLNPFFVPAVFDADFARNAPRFVSSKSNILRYRVSAFVAHYDSHDSPVRPVARRYNAAWHGKDFN